MATKDQFPIVAVNGGVAADLTVTIASGQTISTPQFVGGASLLGIRMPAAWTTGTITFLESSAVNGTYRQVCDGDGNPVVIATPTANLTIKDSSYPAIFYGLLYIKLVSSVVQGADRVIEFVMAQV